MESRKPSDLLFVGLPMLDQLLWVPETSNRGQASVPWDQPIGSLDQTFLLAQHINSSKLWWRRCSLAAQPLPTCQLFLQTLVRMRGPWAGPDLQALGWHRFSAFWLRSKCSICSYQLNIWYESHRLSSILIWFLKGDLVLELAPPKSRVGLALQYRQGSAHFPNNLNGLE